MSGAPASLSSLPPPPPPPPSRRPRPSLLRRPPPRPTRRRFPYQRWASRRRRASRLPCCGRAQPGRRPVSCLSLCGEFLLSASTGSDIVAWQLPDLRPSRASGGHGCGEGAVKALAAAGGGVLGAPGRPRARVARVPQLRERVQARRRAAHHPGLPGLVFRQASYVQVGPAAAGAAGGGSGSSTPTASPASPSPRRTASCTWILGPDAQGVAHVRPAVPRVRARPRRRHQRRRRRLRRRVPASADGRVKAWERQRPAPARTPCWPSSSPATACPERRGGERRRRCRGRRVYAAGSDGHVLAGTGTAAGGTSRATSRRTPWPCCACAWPAISCAPARLTRPSACGAGSAAASRRSAPSEATRAP
ncbi:hypothetical protein ZWY2020_026815 [Hordeum vulgare]|nr:hypothetical protein ZWY2020_026815 [Hordeum vulgare]